MNAATPINTKKRTGLNCLAMTRGNNHMRFLLAPASSNVKPPTIHERFAVVAAMSAARLSSPVPSLTDFNASSRIVYRDAAADSLATYVARAGSIREPTEGITIMWKKFNVTALAVLVFGFASAPRSSAGTEIVEDLSAPAPRYNYAPPPPPPPVYYTPAPVRVVVYPTYRYYAPRCAVFVHPRFFGRCDH